MKIVLIKRIAFLTALWTAGNVAGIAGYNRFVPVMPVPRTAYASAMSEEERALQRADRSPAGFAGEAEKTT